MLIVCDKRAVPDIQRRCQLNQVACELSDNGVIINRFTADLSGYIRKYAEVANRIGKKVIFTQDSIEALLE